MTYFSFSGLVLVIANTILAIVMVIGKKNIENILGFSIAFASILLGFGIFQVGMAETPEASLFWWRFMYVGIILLPPLIIHTSYVLFGQISKRSQYFIITIYLLSAIFFFLNLLGYLIEEITLLFNDIYFDYPSNTLFFVFFLYFAFSFNYVVYFIFRTYQRGFSDENSRKRVLLFGIGIFFGLFGGVWFYLPAFGIMIYPYGGILTSGYSIFIEYAILRHHLFDSRYSALRVLRIFALLGVALVSLVIMSGISEGFLYYTPIFHPIETTIGLMMAFVTWIFYRSRWFSDLFLISSLYEFEKEAQRFLEKKGVYENSLELLHDIETLFQTGIHIERIKIMRNSLSTHFPHVAEYFEHNTTPLILSELIGNSRLHTDLLIHEVENLGSALFPLDVEGATPTVLVLGPKDSGGSLTGEEVKIILRVLPKIALALQILDFSSSLRIEVERQTRAIAKQNHDLTIAYQRLQEIDKNKDNFLAIASHELRTPMTIIKGYADLFLKRTLGEMSEKEEYYMKKIYESTDSLIALVNNILDISKIEAGRIEKNITDIDPHACLEKILGDFREIYREKNITLSLTDTIDSATIRTDEGKFRLILTNLLSNAYKFTLPGGTVTIEAFSDKKLIHVRVCDTGIGIPKDQIASIFDKFNQASSNNDYTKKSIRGTGLGLNLSKQIAEILGGTIIVSSELGKGSCFETTLSSTLG